MSLKRAFIMFFFVVMLPACTCYGIPLQQQFPIWGNNGSNQESQNTGMKCEEFRLTSPRDGLPNGVTTVYWDPVNHATTYEVALFSNGIQIGYWFTSAPATNLTADVSQAAVGGENPFSLRVTAIDQWANVCIDRIILDREAPPRQAPLLPTATATAPPPPPPPTPDCEADPYNENC